MQMIEITSVGNEKVKDTVKLQQKKYRNEKGLFLIEGHKAIYEAFIEKAEICSVFTTAKYIDKFEFVKDKIIVVTDAIMEKISTTAERIGNIDTVTNIDTAKNNKISTIRKKTSTYRYIQQKQIKANR